MKRTVVTLAGSLLALISLHPANSSAALRRLSGVNTSSANFQFTPAFTTVTVYRTVVSFLPEGRKMADGKFAVFVPFPPTSWKIAEGYSIKFDGKGASGTFSGLKGEIIFDEKDLANSRFNVTVSAASINTSNNLKNKHAKSEKYLDVTQFPLIKFTSSSIKASGNGYTATGTLEIHGVKQQISMPFQFKASGNGGTFTSSIEVSRETYKIGSSSWLLGDKMKVDISVPVTK